MPRPWCRASVGSPTEKLDRRADRLAHHLAGAGIGPEDRVGVQLTNGTEYVETMLASFKIRAVPVNVNYRYVAHGLEHLYADAGLVGLVFHRRFGASVSAALGSMAEQRAVLEVADGSAPVGIGPEYEEALAPLGRGPGLPCPLGRRSVLRLYGWHHRTAQRGGVAPRRHLHCGHGWRRPILLG